MKFDYKELVDEVRSKNFWPRLLIMVVGVFILAVTYNLFFLKYELVTGGTSGIGKEIVLELLKQGCKVVTCYSQNEENALEKERRLQEATIEIRNKFGKNALLKGTNLKEGATTKDLNRQIGGHKAYVRHKFTKI